MAILAFGLSTGKYCRCRSVFGRVGAVVCWRGFCVNGKAVRALISGNGLRREVAVLQIIAWKAGTDYRSSLRMLSGKMTFHCSRE